MNRFVKAAMAALAFVLLPTIARADGVTIVVSPWLAPNVYGSPSVSQAIQNAAAAQQSGASTYGSAGPTQYNTMNTATTAQAIVTGFNSWMGVADPANSAYAGELGNRITFAAAITSTTAFSIKDLSFAMSSSPITDFNGVSKAAGSYSYGFNYNSGGTLTSYWIGVTSDGTIITDPNSTALVTKLYGSGSGASEDAYCDNCTHAQRQAAIDAAASNPSGPYTVYGTYSLQGTSGTGSILLTAPSATPEPSTLALLGTGILGVAGTVRRRRAA